MDLAFDNLQRLIFHKTQTNELTKEKTITLSYKNIILTNLEKG